MKERTIYALGFFDGVHLGHQALLKACAELAKEQNCSAGVVTFSSHPDTLVFGRTPGLINTPEDRDRLLRCYGMEQVISLPFDREMMEMPWQVFFRMLLTRYGAAGLVCGEDFCFGVRGEGNSRKLKAACEEKGIPCAVIPQLKREGTTVSSTCIRKLLYQGNMERAVEFLGHPHMLTGRVVHGRHLGSRLGFPTANLLPEQGLVVPRFGVYACIVGVGGKYYPAVTNVGTRPTVSGLGVTVEPWILDYSGDLYGREITVLFYRFLRAEQKFPSLDALKQEIDANAAQTRECFRSLDPAGIFGENRKTCFPGGNPL